MGTRFNEMGDRRGTLLKSDYRVGVIAIGSNIYFLSQSYGPFVALPSFEGSIYPESEFSPSGK